MRRLYPISGPEPGVQEYRDPEPGIGDDYLEGPRPSHPLYSTIIAVHVQLGGVYRRKRSRQMDRLLAKCVRAGVKPHDIANAIRFAHARCVLEKGQVVRSHKYYMIPMNALLTLARAKKETATPAEILARRDALAVVGRGFKARRQIYGALSGIVSRTGTPTIDTVISAIRKAGDLIADVCRDRALWAVLVDACVRMWPAELPNVIEKMLTTRLQPRFEGVPA